MPRIVCISDTHNCNEQISVPDGDILIHGGDATINGSIQEVSLFAEWFLALPHKYKIFIAGNHDWLFETDPPAARKLIAGAIYLEDSSTEIDGLKFYGSPWQPRFFDWAFNLNRGPQMAEKWKMIPSDTDILITHGPPNGILDEVPRRGGFIENTGCEELRKKVEEVKPKLHVFGHIHCGYGQAERFGVKFVNASNCNEDYEPVQAPIVVDI